MTDKFGAAMTLVKSDIGTVRDYFFLSAYLLILVMLSACFFFYIYNIAYDGHLSTVLMIHCIFFITFGM